MSDRELEVIKRRVSRVSLFRALLVTVFKSAKLISKMSAHKDLENGVHRDYADGANGEKLEQKESGNTNELRQMLTNNTLTDAQFEAMFLSPRNRGVVGDLRKTVANPTPLGIMGFATGLTPLAAQLMGWRGSGGAAQSSVRLSLPSCYSPCKRFALTVSSGRRHNLVRRHAPYLCWTR